MLLSCPSCATQFQVDAAALGAEGRSVRCAQCRHRWFAAAPMMADAAMAEAESFVSAPRGFAASGSAMAERPFAVSALADGDFADAASEAVVIEDSPPIAAGLPAAMAIMPEERAAASEAELPRPVRSRRRARPFRLPRPALAFCAVIGLFAALLGPRATIVGVVPEFAGLYAAIGFPVNLRGLEFRGVKTTREMQDGIPVLVIEGEVVNVTRHSTEIPRVRLAVLGEAGQELYSWTTLLQRSILGVDEKVAFRSRLASPPADARQVLVRFLTRADLTGDGR